MWHLALKQQDSHLCSQHLERYYVTLFLRLDHISSSPTAEIQQKLFFYQKQTNSHSLSRSYLYYSLPVLAFAPPPASASPEERSTAHFASFAFSRVTPYPGNSLPVYPLYQPLLWGRREDFTFQPILTGKEPSARLQLHSSPS